MCLILILSNTASFGCLKALKKSNINFKGVIQALFFLAMVFTASSLASEGYSKSFSTHKLDDAYKSAVAFQTVSVILGCIWLTVSLISTSIPPLERVIKRFGKVYFVITASIILLMNVTALLLYPIMRMVVTKNKESSDEADDPDYAVWNGLLITGTIFVGPTIMMTIMFNNEDGAQPQSESHGLIQDYPQA